MALRATGVGYSASTVCAMPLGLAGPVRCEMAATRNKMLSNTRVLHDLYGKSHRLMRGMVPNRSHLLMDKCAGGLIVA